MPPVIDGGSNRFSKRTPDGHDNCLTNAADLVYKLYRIKLSGDLNG